MKYDWKAINEEFEKNEFSLFKRTTLPVIDVEITEDMLDNPEVEVLINNFFNNLEINKCILQSVKEKNLS